MKSGTPKRRRPFAWSVAMLDELEGVGIEDRQEQARAMGVSLPQIDRIRKALRDDHRPRRTKAKTILPSRETKPTAELVQLGLRVPQSIAARLRRHAAQKGVSVALLGAVALHDWLAAHGTRGPGPLTAKEREALGL